MAKQEVNGKFSVGIGKKVEPIKAEIVTIEDMKLVPVKDKNNNINQKLILICKHSQKPNLELSKVKYNSDGKTLDYSGTWWKLDEEGKLLSSTALAQMLVFFGCECAEDLLGKELPTELDESGKYLVIKAY